MKRVIDLYVLAATMVAALAATAIAQGPCLTMTAPFQADEGTIVDVQATIKDPKLAAKYELARQKIEWSVNAGKIASGQGTPAIKLDTTSAADRTIMVRAEVTGLPKVCDNIAVATIPIGPLQAYRTTYTGKVTKVSEASTTMYSLDDMPVTSIKAHWAIAFLYAKRYGAGPVPAVVLGLRLGNEKGHSKPPSEGTFSLGAEIRNIPITLSADTEEYPRETVGVALISLPLDAFHKIAASEQQIVITLGDDTITISPDIVKKFAEFESALSQ